MKEEKVYFKNKRGQKLVGVLHEPEKRTKIVIILCHGFTTDKDEGGIFVECAKKLCEGNFAVLRFDFRGCGESEGDYSKITLTKLKSDALTILNYVKSQKNINKVNVLGQSFGTVVIIALNPKVNSIILTGSLAYPKKIMSNLFDVYNPDGISEMKHEIREKILIDSQFWKDLDNYNLLELVKNIKCPIMFIHGGDDKIVPVDSGVKELFENANPPKKLEIIENESHGYFNYRKELLNIIREWFKKWLK